MSVHGTANGIVDGSWIPFAASVASSVQQGVVGVPQRESWGSHLEVEQRPVRVWHRTSVVPSEQGAKRVSRVYGRRSCDSHERSWSRTAMPPSTISSDPGLRLLFVGINPGLWTAATGTHFAHPGNRFYPALLRAGLIERPIDRGSGHGRRRPRPPDRARHRHHQPRRPGDRQGVGALGGRVASRWRAAGGVRRASSAGGRGDRRHHGVPRRVRGPSGRVGTAARAVRRRPSCGSCRTRADSTPTRRSTPWPSRTAPRPRPRASSDSRS